MRIQRRQFIKFLGYSGLMISATAGCAFTTKSEENIASKGLGFLKPSSEDKLKLIAGLDYKIIAKWQDHIGSTENPQLKFGAHCDFTEFVPINNNPNEGILIVNHEYLNSLFCGWSALEGKAKTKEQVFNEMKEVGFSLVHIKQDSGEWSLITNSKYNARFDAHKQIPFSDGHIVYGSTFATGTLANCAGGKTPWNTFLSCEENYNIFYGEWDFAPKTGTKKLRKKPIVHYDPKTDFSWYNHVDYSPLHYGWVVEVNPFTQKAKKLVSLGRFSHEGATCVLAKDGRTVVYMGDDANDQFIYKFISAKPNSLDKGILYVADTLKGRWLPIEMQSHPDFKKLFKNHTELMVHTRMAAEILGATPQDRPEDIEINPLNGDIIVALTNNKPRGRPHGSLLKIKEKNSDVLSLKFSSETWISGGEQNVMSCPDNLIFDKSGNLWITSDISDESLNVDVVYDKYKNNGLYYIPAKGRNAGQVFQVASAPVEAEFTGPSFSPDGQTLFLCVQHPGEQTKEIGQFTSHWPEGNGKMPKSAVVAISGPALAKLTAEQI